MKRVAAVLPVLLLAVACGGGGEDAKAEYLKAAEAICQDALAQREELAKAFPSDPAALPAYVDRAVGTVRDYAQRLDGLAPPEADRPVIEEKVLEPLRQQLTVAEKYAQQIRAAAEAKDDRQLTALLFDPPLETRADIAFMREYGFDACARAADTSRLASGA